MKNAVVNINIIVPIEQLAAEELAAIMTGAGTAGPVQVFGEVRNAMIAHVAAEVAAELRAQAAKLEQLHARSL